MEVWYLVIDNNQDYDRPDVFLYGSEDEAKIGLQSYINSNLVSFDDQPIGTWEHALGFIQSDEHGYQAWIGSRVVEV